VTPAEEPRQHREARLRLSASTTIRGDVQGFTRRKNAKVLDPHDPTPWFYEAILKQTTNRPVGALHDLQRAIALNDNRAVYRSSLLLDEDFAARSKFLRLGTCLISACTWSAESL
jgi:hypothetical protein